MNHQHPWFVALDQVRFDGRTHVRGLTSRVNLLGSLGGTRLIEYAKVYRPPVAVGLNNDSQKLPCADKKIQVIVDVVAERESTSCQQSFQCAECYSTVLIEFGESIPNDCED